MKTIQLTHGDQHLDLSEQEAVSLHNALSEALSAAAIDPLKHSALEKPKGVHTFQRASSPTLTDC